MIEALPYARGMSIWLGCAALALTCLMVRAGAENPPKQQAAPAPNTPATKQAETPQTEPTQPKARHEGWMGLVLYLPNRVFDLLDIFRVRVRVGPGAAVGVRATSAASVYLGSYLSVWAGLPGPRRMRIPPIPCGTESHNGIGLSFLNASADGMMGPGYSPTECGVSLHLAIVGLDLDVDPMEALDFVTGFIGIDLRKDDL